MSTHFFRKALSRLLPNSFLNVIRTYRYRIELTNPDGLAKRFFLFVQTLLKTLNKSKMVLFYPDEPLDFHIIYKILRFLGHRTTSNAQHKCDLAILWWRDSNGSPYAPNRSNEFFKESVGNGINILNIRCNDVSKARVNIVFEEVFGYSIQVDPEKYFGKCVMKLNGNGLHKGRIIDCPTSRRDGDFVYQKLIHNETADGFVEDIRVPIYGKRTPFVYLKHRAVKDRLIDRPHTNTATSMAEVSKVLSEEELNKINIFAEIIGLDCGEVDVLRDQKDGRIYIVDVNNFPSGPPSPISNEEGNEAIIKLAETFSKSFGV